MTALPRGLVSGPRPSTGGQAKTPGLTPPYASNGRPYAQNPRSYAITALRNGRDRSPGGEGVEPEVLPKLAESGPGDDQVSIG